MKNELMIETSGIAWGASHNSKWQAQTQTLQHVSGTGGYLVRVHVTECN